MGARFQEKSRTAEARDRRPCTRLARTLALPDTLSAVDYRDRIVVLDLDSQRTVVPPRPAATVVLLRDGADGLELAVMQRSLESKFLGGAVVFPGGRVEPHDARSSWGPALVSTAEGTWWDDEGFASRVAACREALEEVGLVPLTGTPLSREELATLRAAAAAGSGALRDALAKSSRALDLSALHPLSRWVTPEAEQRRFDTRFFLSRAPVGQEAAIDQREAIRTFWSTPARLLEDWRAGSIALFPPTHRTIERLLDARTVDAALASAANAVLDPICPRFVLDAGVPVLALPGDPLHEVKERRIAGGSRYVLRDDRWLSEDAPSLAPDR